MNKFGIILMLMGARYTNMAQDLPSEGNFPPPEIPATIEVSRAANPITIDGALTEGEWVKVVPISDFFRREPRQGGPIRYETEVKFLYDDKYLYVGAFCKDSAGLSGIRVQDIRRDFEWGVTMVRYARRDNEVSTFPASPHSFTPYRMTYAAKLIGIESCHPLPQSKVPQPMML